MNNIVNRIKNWKTTLFGALGAFLITAGGLIANGVIDYKIIIGASLTAGIGFILKDPKKSEVVILEEKHKEKLPKIVEGLHPEGDK